ncbi:MAG: MerC domain-containing protein [Chitinophagales bacterium]
MKITALKTDKVGIIPSTLCMIYCIATPFLFLAQPYSASCCKASPSWWRSLHFIFEYAIYLPGMLLVLLHIYNLKYCQFQINTCCINCKTMIESLFCRSLHYLLVIKSDCKLIISRNH